MATGASSTGARARTGETRGSKMRHLLLETTGERCSADASDASDARATVDAWTRHVDEVERLTVCRDARAWCR